MKIFGLMATVLVFFCEFAMAARTPEVPVRSSRSLRQQVDSYAELLQKEVVKSKNTKERFRVLQNSLMQIRELRLSSAPQSATDEAHMDLLVSVLEALPKEREFRKKNCATYETEILNQFEPAAEEDPTEPAVKPAWDFLKSVCA